MNCIEYGTFFGNPRGQTDPEAMIPFDDKPFLRWGYLVEEGAHVAVCAPTWFASPNLRECFDVPEQATAVRIHIKAKAKTITWTPVNVTADLQVSVRRSGDTHSPNEVIHAFAHQKGASGVAIEDINSVAVDVALGDDGCFELFAQPTILGDYAELLLAVTLVGYWMPLKERLL